MSNNNKGINYGSGNSFSGNVNAVNTHYGDEIFYGHSFQVPNPPMYRRVFFRIPPKVRKGISIGALAALIADCIAIGTFVVKSGGVINALFHHLPGPNPMLFFGVFSRRWRH